MVLGVLEDGELPPDHESDSERLSNLGGILFGVAADASGSESEATSEGSEHKSRKKRKRST